MTAQGFDPLAILALLERHRVAYVLVGELAGVLQGSGRTTTTVEIVPKMRDENLNRLQSALDELGARGSRNRRAESSTATLSAEPTTTLRTSGGQLVITPTPAGTRGFDDLRRQNTREPLGMGIRVPVASTGDLVRIAAAVDDPAAAATLSALRQIAEHARGPRR